MIDFELGLEEGGYFEGDQYDPPSAQSMAVKKIYIDPALPVASQLNTAEARVKFAVYEKAIADMLDRAKAHAVTDDVTNHEAVAMASQSKAIANKIEKLRKQTVDEPNQFVKAVNTFAKNYTGKLSDIETGLKAKINTYQREQERKRIEAQKNAIEEAQRLQAEVDAASAEIGETSPVMVQPVILETPSVTRTDSGSASLRKVWTWKLTDFSQVPDEFKVTKDTAINQAVRAGVRNIPGLEIYEQSTTVIRSSGID